MLAPLQPQVTASQQEARIAHCPACPGLVVLLHGRRELQAAQPARWDIFTGACLCTYLGGVLPHKRSSAQRQTSMKCFQPAYLGLGGVCLAAWPGGRIDHDAEATVHKGEDGARPAVLHAELTRSAVIQQPLKPEAPSQHRLPSSEQQAKPVPLLCVAMHLSKVTWPVSDLV